jgi:spermidine synthase
LQIGENGYIQPDKRANEAAAAPVLRIVSMFRVALNTPAGHSGARPRASLIACAAALIVFFVFDLAGHRAWSESLFDGSVRAQMLKHSDGLVAHVKTEYNNIFIIKRGPFLFLTTRFRREDHIQSVVNLEDPDDLMAPYTRIASVALAYPETVQRILMIGLGAGSISTYIGRAMPDVHIDAVELDPGVIAVGKRYFGLQETGGIRFIQGDGQTYLRRHEDRYDIILLDAFRERGVPSDLRTREFYTLVKERLAPHGVAVFNIAVGPKFYRSTLVSLREVFQTVDIYPDRAAGSEEQAIAVALPARKPSRDILMQRARALQGRFRFRYSLPVLMRGRAAESREERGAERRFPTCRQNVHLQEATGR